MSDFTNLPATEQNSQGNGNIAPPQKKSLKTHLNAKNKPFDPSKPFKNPKDEIMARARADGLNKVDAYQKAFPKASYDSARALSNTIERKGIDVRALHILAERGMTEGDLFQSLIDCVRSSDERIKLDSTKFGLGMIGYGKDQKDDNKSYNPTKINIIIQHKDSNDNELHQ